ncbi:MAG: DUF4388 domain-containing protein [Myxococcales bacterium]|nr:DUF4388 domain-containing protein [Myxococcales bacterium]
MPTAPPAPSRRPDGVFMWGDIIDGELLIDLVGFLNQCRRTAALTVVDGTVRKSIFFREGHIVAASSNLPEDRFGDVMYRRGLIERADLDAALAEVGQGKRIGNVLLSRGLISGSDLWKVIKYQIEEVVFSVLLVERGQFTVADYDPAQVPTRTTVEAQHVLLEGLRRKDEMMQVRAELPPLDRRLVRTGTARAVGGVEAAVYDLVDGELTVGQVLRACGLGAFSATHVTHRLLKAGIIQAAAPTAPIPVEATPGTPVAAIIDGFNEAYARVHATVGDRADALRAGIDADFFAEVDPRVAALFQGVAPDADGRLPADPLFLNLRVADVPDKVQVLRRGLQEYLRFLLFAAREVLPYERVEGLAGDVLALVREL